ncbi:MAG TPA: hypothetical protein VFM93_12890 [Candidatus Limnocylindria bacterium]|nr:hypothetical protein [Candidatus Limnocylindria bacterium]
MSLTLALFLPALVMSLAGVIGIGTLRATAERARAAADLAVLVAVNDQDDAELARTGTLVLARDATTVARVMFAANLAPIAAFLASDPGSIAAGADVTAAGGTVSIAARVPVRAPLLGAPIAPATVPVAVRASASAR